MRRHLIASLTILLFPILVSALPRDGAAPVRHYILESTSPLDAAASSELAAQGVEVQQPLANHRYLVRMRDGVVPEDARIRSLRPYDAPHKIARSAYAEASQGKAFARLRIMFHADVTFADAQNAIDAAGGTIESPFAVVAANPQRMTVRIPSSAVMTLANDERVFGIYGPPLHPRALNAVAAAISNVTPLYTAPYNLTGDGVVLSIFEPDGTPDVTDLEFGPRLISHFASSAKVDDHATHVSGTMIAAGINAQAKGMVPTATLQAFDANAGDLFSLSGPKAKLTTFNSVADNNSWDYALSWGDDGVWYGSPEALGAYSALESEPYDAIMRTAGEPLILHAAGNDATDGNPQFALPWFPHKHFNYDTNMVDTHTYCYSQNGSGTDCPAASFNCSSGATYCETTKHPTHGASGTVGLMASTKNSIAVGATEDDGVTIADFSSQGPTTDGRVKPELVAVGWKQYSTLPGNRYTDGTNCSCPGFGTSMATPVVSGIAGLVTQQYRKTFGKTPSASILKTLLIAGADDLGNPGPDYVFGFGRVDAKASVDLILADNGTGNRIRTGTVANGQDVDIPISLAAAQKLRVVLGWFDPEVLLVPDPTVNGDDPLADKTLVNDLDLYVKDPTGAIVRPYVLNPVTPGVPATRGVNHTDTTEEVEIANAVPGVYHIHVFGAIGDTRSLTQDYVVAMTGGTAVAPCTDAYEPNDTQATAFGNLLSGQTITPKICSSTDIDYFTFTSGPLSPVSVTVVATDTPLKVTLSSSRSVTVTANIAAGGSAKLDPVIDDPLISPIPNLQFFVRVEANGTVGATGAYTLTPTYTFTSTPRRRATKH
jgi:subtilisin family serine protease